MKIKNNVYGENEGMEKITEKDKVEQLYKIYGFEKTEETDEFIVFTYSNGYFHNVEIVRFDDKKSVENIKLDYEDIGYSVRIIDYISCEQTHHLLFNGFFSVENIHKRLLGDYANFCELQSRKLFDEQYEYVQPTFTWNNSTGEGKLSSNILEQLRKEGPQLIILEAAAGYGKTCTSYEIVKEIADQDTAYAPIFTELSKNRKAALFRYVLLDEIDRKFTTLSSDLVISEIQNGNVPLIIDGFDELISRSNKDMGYDDIADDESKTMLDTIAELYQEGCSTKIVLTSRKSAIFTGDIFEEWANKHLPFCNITRVSIEEPTIKDWIGYEKANYLEKQRIPFSSIVNPILLAFMRGLDEDKFKSICSNVEQVIKYYFESLLERERERQALQLSVEEQYEIMEKLAYNFVDFDIFSEELSFIRDLFMDIIHENFKIYRERYISIEERPTEEEFATKLAGHALLNRISPRKNEIGFINDFIFGIFIGDNIMKNQSILEKMDGKYVEIACTAYASRSEDKRDTLLNIVMPYITRLNYEQQLEIELKLANTIKRDYKQHYFSNRIFNPDMFFDGSFKFRNCTFRNCTFKECIIMTSAFVDCHFYDCKFYDVMVDRDTTENCRLLFANCSGHEEFAQLASYVDEISYEEDDYEKTVLSRYWGKGERFSKGKLPEMLLLNTHSNKERTGIVNALESLKRKELIFKDGHYWYLNKDKINEIKEKLGMQ